jgi:hypothetical protein
MSLYDEWPTLKADDLCPFCGGWHSTACPQMRRVRFGAGGAVAEVEYWRWGRWPHGRVLWAEEIPGEKQMASSCR